MNGHSYGRGIGSSSLSSRQFANYYSFKRKGEPGRRGEYTQSFNRSAKNMFWNDKDFNPTQQYPSQLLISPSSSSLRHRQTYSNLIPNQPLTKQVDQLLYEIPDFKFTKNSLFQPPEFLKVFSDIRCIEGSTAIFDCMILGSPRPKVCWLFNDEKLTFDDVILEDTSDICRCTIKYVCNHHYGSYTVLVENEAGRAITTAMLLPIK
uniref:Ig-like domain-containing protein n=2 Tax=Meloidogyne TaxID=189290 RepID=A0A914LY05_MELIC|nr:unnamed protein product [Meloidogyne enterolobii]